MLSTEFEGRGSPSICIILQILLCLISKLCKNCYNNIIRTQFHEQFHETVFFHDHDHDRYTCDDKPSCKMANKATHQSSSHKKMNITVFQNVCGHFLQISIKVQGIIAVIEMPHFSLPARCQNGGPSCLE